jgi:NADPH-dependent 2,4-dienoyl-CoA reductase/sulfur reductase-like enzyme
MTDTNVAIIGAGPYGLAAAAHLRRAGVDVHVMGEPMSFWQSSMPAGLLLRSNWTATCIAEYQGELSLDSFCAATGASFGTPVPLDRFIDYGMWVQQQVAPDVDRRPVKALEAGPGGFRLTLADGTAMSARRVVVAAGIALFANRPAAAAGLPSDLASHTGDHRDFRRFNGARVLVVGGGQSALECAALLHESGARVEVAVRQDHVIWLHGGKYQRMLGRYAPLVYAPTDVGPMGLSRLVAVPDLFRRLPRRTQDPLAYRSIRPAGAAWLPPRLTEVPIRLGRTVVSATAQDGELHVTFADGDTQTVDHLLFGTGYRVDITRYPFLTAELTARIRRAGGYPLLGRGMESSVPGLHFLGAPAAWSFGPIVRFVSGGWYTSRELVRAIAGPSRLPGEAEPAPVPARAGREP